MNKRAILTFIALLGIAAFACNSVPFLAGSTDAPAMAETADTGGEESARAENPTPEEAAQPEDTPAPEDACGGQEEGTVEVRWFIGMGTGTDPVQVRAEQEVVKNFNNSQDKIRLVMEIVPYDSAKDVLSTQIASGNGPDIIGPVGWGGSNAFHGQWLDLAPYIECSGYDTSQFNSSLVDMYETSEGTVGLPFAVYPSMLFYRRQLFDEAGMNYPPKSYGEKYVMPNGTELDWNWDTLREVARMLTIDTAGRNSAESGFNKNAVMQYGFTWQWQNHPNYWGSYWAGGSMVAEDGRTAQAPEAWVESWKWSYEGIWGSQPFMGNAAVEGSQEYNGGNPFDSGRIAMIVHPLWFTCCIGNVRDWDAAAIPSYNGVVGGRIDADTFRIWKGTKHPLAAFIAMTYLVGEGVDILIMGSEDIPAAYGALPARTANQAAWRAAREQQFPWVKNWDAVLAGLSYPDVPSAESYMPNYNEAWTRGNTFADLLRNTRDLNLDKEIDTYLADLDVIFSK
ncbi:MAG: extracellular solute-binding protein [Anaerolineales bacterium]|nr:extracellular solute-binding protein [Anaerolineales bacterium]